jgi:hypothetical protein
MVLKPSLGSFVQLRLELWHRRRGKSLHCISRSAGTWWDALPMSWGCQVPATRMKTLSPNPGQAPSNVTGISNRDMGHKGFSGNNIY